MDDHDIRMSTKWRYVVIRSFVVFDFNSDYFKNWGLISLSQFIFQGELLIIILQFLNKFHAK